MKFMNLKLVALALLSAFFMSCEKDTESFNDAEEAITETEDTGYVSTKVNPAMTYYLRGKQIVDKGQIEGLLETAIHMEVEENNWHFYPTEAEQKSRLQAKAKSNSPTLIKRNTYLFHYGKHNGQPFHHMTNNANSNYGRGAWIHHKSNRRFYAPLWKKITRGLTLMNFNRSVWPNVLTNSSGYTFYSRKNYGGRSLWYGVNAQTVERNINLPWHIGSHKQ